MIIKIAKEKSELEKIFQLRYEVLRKPWNQPFESSFDEKDELSLNAYIEEKNICVACGRLDIIDYTTGQIRYMAVHPEYRNQQLGKRILEYLEKQAIDKGIQTIILHARENALSFYLQNKYKLVKKSYLLFDVIQHYLMEKNLMK
ncbi:MAG: GNAT family N-acetyltransferase [Bacteroidota bacterium]